jgi:hypothetical protein
MVRLAQDRGKTALNGSKEKEGSLNGKRMTGERTLLPAEAFW